MEDRGGNKLRIKRVLIFTIATRRKKSYGIGEYVTPNKQPMMQWVEQALTPCPAWKEMILVGYLSTCLAHKCDQRKDDLASAIAYHTM